jgi:ferrous iron transport protein B
MKYTVCLAGNPNCGKTTLFNALTGSNQYVGNWPGVTVEKKEAKLRFGGDEIRVVDLPGVYSLTPYSIEEKIARDYIDSGAADVVVNIVDATNLERNLYLTLQLLARGRRVVIALNLMDELKKRGVGPDIARLSEAIGAPVAPISAKKNQGIDGLMALVARAAREKKEPAPRTARAGEDGLADDAFIALAKARYERIERALSTAGFPRGAYQRTVSDAADGLVMNRYLAFPLFFAFMALMFAVTFGAPGEGLRVIMERVISLAGKGAALLLNAARAPAWARSLAVDGVLAGVGGVLAFLPQILLLFFCMSVMEDSGYMARAAFMTDRPLRRLGLSGRSFIPMLMGFGCTTTAVIAARGVENERDRRMTIMLTPYMSCGAKLPVYALFAAAFFPASRAGVVLGLYGLGVCAMVLAGAAMRKIWFRTGETPFVMELPEYRMPTVKSVLRRLSDRARDFMTRAGTVIFAMSVLIWFLRAFTPGLRPTGEIADSMLGALGAFVSPVFRPLGFGDATKCVALVAGMVAKEAVVSTMRVIYAAADAGALITTLSVHFTRASAVSYLVFILLYTPCVSALAAMRRELGSARWLLRAALSQLALAWVFAFCAYRLALLLI